MKKRRETGRARGRGGLGRQEEGEERFKKRRRWERETEREKVERWGREERRKREVRRGEEGG